MDRYTRMTIKTLYDNTPVKAEFSVPETEMPTDARVVIVGGGIAGTSIAYHFAKHGWDGVYLLEQNQLSSGTTWHSAGQVGQLRSSAAQTKVNKASTELYERLLAETGHDPGWLNCGGLQLATSDERMHQLRRTASMAQVFEVETHLVSPDQCREYWPMLNIGDVKGGVYISGDGRVLPGECTIALAKGALQGGVKILEGVAVEQLLFDELKNSIRRFKGVVTNRGTITAEWVVLACNMWMRQLGNTAGVDIPVYPCEHHYVITRPIDGVTRDCPCTRDPDAGLYFRALDDGSLKLGAFKKRSKPWQIGDRVPNDFSFGLLDPDWPDFAEPFAAHMHRLKGIGREDVVKFINGPEAFTPDNNFILGQPFCTDGLFVAGGWNSAGIACAGGAGKYAVEWIEAGGMTLDLGAVDIRRFVPFQNGRKYLQERVSEVLGLHYQMAWPGRQMETARDVRSSALYEVHRQNNACFGEVLGWERPLFYAPHGIPPKIDYSFVRQNWHDWVSSEVKACRDNVAILDQSTFAKFIVRGSDALELLQQLCGANVDQPVGRAIYTGMFNSNGKYESDLTVVRVAKDEFYVVTATGQQAKDHDWIVRHIANKNVTAVDVTDHFNVLSVMGPKSGEVLAKIFPELAEQSAFGTVRELRFQQSVLRAIRVSYVGEPGWELHVKREHALPLYEELADAGAEFDIRLAGNYAISAMRIEMGFRAFGHELSSDETPLEAGLGWTIDWEKDFLGKRALLAQKNEGAAKRLVCFSLWDPNVMLWGSEPIYWNDNVVGYTTSACFSPTLGKSIAMGYVKSPTGRQITAMELSTAVFEIEQIGKRYLADASFRAPIRGQHAER